MTSGAVREPVRATIASLLVCRTDAPGASRLWLEQRARPLRAVDYVRAARVVTAGDPPRAGIVLHFEVGEAYERFCHEHLPQLRRSLERARWSVGRPVQRVLERTG